MPRTCAFCGGVDATRIAEWSGRGYPSCDQCARPPRVSSDPPPLHLEDVSFSAQAVMVARERPGLTAGQIAAELGVSAGSKLAPTRDERNRYNVVTKALSRAVADGVLVRIMVDDIEDDEDIGTNVARYFATDKQWSPVWFGHGKSARRAA